MATLSKIFYQWIFVAILCFIHSQAIAQNEISQELSSLKGIQQLGFIVNLEANIALVNNNELDVSSFKKMGKKTLRSGNILLIPDNEIQHSDEIPFLYLHVNAMDAGKGLVPFALTLYLYQPVKLTLNRNTETSAITWESGLVGIVSNDNMDVISKAVQGLLKEFISDYTKINSTN